MGCVLVFYGGYGTGNPAERQGREQAQADVRAGKLRIKTVTNQPAWSGVAWRLLSERYRLEVDVTDPSLFTQDQRYTWNQERNAYNRVMTAEMQRRYGKDVFARTEREARTQIGDWSHSEAKVNYATPPDP